MKERRKVIIDSSMVGMGSTRNYRRTDVTARRFFIAEYKAGLAEGSENAVGGETAEAENSEDAKKAQSAKQTASLEDWQGRLQMSTGAMTVRSSPSQTAADIRQRTIRYIFDLLFSGRRFRFRDDWGQNNSYGYEDYSGAYGTSGTARQEQKAVELKPIAVTMKTLNYSQETYSYEQEDTSFSTVGTVKTADGREIKFNVNVGMSREFEEYYREDLQLAQFTLCDPLVINLDTDAAQLEDQTFYFDIDADGEQDEISRLGSGSGYLALDKNGDGVINDGSELFGTTSGDGFKDLAKYDEDGNGWIDENDAIWDKLKIWCKDENGNDVLYRLADKGVGAVCLQNVSTDFTVKGQTGQTRGVVRNTGVFLYENGLAGTVQHLDVAKYDKGA